MNGILICFLSTILVALARASTGNTSVIYIQNENNFSNGLLSFDCACERPWDRVTGKNVKESTGTENLAIPIPPQNETQLSKSKLLLCKRQDPCTDSATGTFSRSIFDVPFCDASISPIWYKIDEKTGEDIATECVTFGTCGTVYPLWIDGIYVCDFNNSYWYTTLTHRSTALYHFDHLQNDTIKIVCLHQEKWSTRGSIPTEAEGIVDRKICQVIPGNCCNKTYTIQVKNCGDFRVYKLAFTDGCYQAYCIQASDDEVEDCGRKGNFKCGEGNTGILIGITLSVIFLVLILSVIVWCFFRRRPSGLKKPIMTNDKRSSNDQQIVCVNNGMDESVF